MEKTETVLALAGFLAFKIASIGWGHVSHSTMHAATLVCVIQVSGTE